jgi:2-polyprenyl-3-methyl-5-hydroxy-6-metoxy-1,4-benzoquinol methylase
MHSSSTTTTDLAQAHQQEVKAGERFLFGANWARFLALLDEKRIQTSMAALQEFLGVQRLDGKSFIDIGSGSGLSSLAARRLGARVHSLDYDADSVACTQALRDRFYPGDPLWTVERASVLEAQSLPHQQHWDVVYSWGVLHHTGQMWKACENAAALVAPGGKLFIAIYNDQRWASVAWLRTKQLYNALPPALRFLVVLPCTALLWGPKLVRDTFLHGNPLKSWRAYSREGQRGMSPWYDIIDWVGGLPFEVAKPEEMLDFHRARGFNLVKLASTGGRLGCNQFVFERQA